MTLDDETAERIAQEMSETYYGGHLRRDLVKAGYAARDAEVEELRAERDKAREEVGYEKRMRASISEELDHFIDLKRKAETERDGALATLAKVARAARGFAANGDFAAQVILALLDESPTERETHPFLPVAGHPDDPECAHRSDGTDATYCGELADDPIHDVLGVYRPERETPADEVLSGRIVTASFETGEPWPCGLEDCECPEHDSPAPPKGTYVTVRLDDEEVPVGLWPVRIARVPEARGEVVPDGHDAR